MKKILFLLTPLFCLNAQVDLDYYLGDTSNYNQSIPTPESVICLLYTSDAADE